MATLHDGLKVRSGGATKAQVEEMLKNTDANGDGKITHSELESLAARGRASGFADQAALDLFHTGLDAGGLAEVKSREAGQQFSTDYLDNKAKPLLSKTYGANNADRALEIVAPQASSELNEASARRFEDRASFDRFERGAIRRHLGSGSFLDDTNKNGKADADDRQLVSDGRGGYRWMLLGNTKADAIAKDSQSERDRTNSDRGLREAGETFPGLKFPSYDQNADPSIKKENISRWMGGKSHDEGGAWKAEPRASEPAKGYVEFKLDTTRMKPTEALDDIAKNPGKYCMDCSMAKQLAQHMRARRALGDDEFNRLATKHGMVFGHSEASNRNGFVAGMTDVVPGGAGKPLGEWEKGWQGYAKITVPGNAQATERLSAQWSGEHFTIGVNEAGEKVVLAHPFGEVPVADFEKTLRQRVATAGGVSEDQVQIEIKPPIDIDLEYARTRM